MGASSSKNRRKGISKRRKDNTIRSSTKREKSRGATYSQSRSGQRHAQHIARRDNSRSVSQRSKELIAIEEKILKAYPDITQHSSYDFIKDYPECYDTLNDILRKQTEEALNNEKQEIEPDVASASPNCGNSHTEKIIRTRSHGLVHYSEGNSRIQQASQNDGEDKHGHCTPNFVSSRPSFDEPGGEIDSGELLKVLEEGMIFNPEGEKFSLEMNDDDKMENISKPPNSSPVAASGMSHGTWLVDFPYPVGPVLEEGDRKTENKEEKGLDLKQFSLLSSSPKVRIRTGFTPKETPAPTDEAATDAKAGHPAAAADGYNSEDRSVSLERIGSDDGQDYLVSENHGKHAYSVQERIESGAHPRHNTRNELAEEGTGLSPPLQDLTINNATKKKIYAPSLCLDDGNWVSRDTVWQRSLIVINLDTKQEEEMIVSNNNQIGYIKAAYIKQNNCAKETRFLIPRTDTPTGARVYILEELDDRKQLFEFSIGSRDRVYASTTFMAGDTLNVIEY
mmetsp:Transcript_7896/g.14662  ORF Transcript_7896/g.14662 Transcript_7896/m.14662 type:complete len:508 (+) Transcript_7896:300-1823(+)|eukprot:CAMPEP_0197530612 /NCGR_PEP_ID=MMETSP1318-20131121/32406_1 /TAXON_ID=552666 /ORGANISM="Partenskyella glossopodia, Strain RCC365" /LENGTH=507 /DNA_ID=CAMNT_0043086513 /DNA_START=236 /DNA_END=1759 /DNA_ORIENTATION=+